MRILIMRPLCGRQYLWIFFVIPLYYEIIKDKNFDKYLKKNGRNYYCFIESKNNYLAMQKLS